MALAALGSPASQCFQHITGFLLFSLHRGTKSFAPPPKKKSDFQSLKVQIWPKIGLWVILGQIFAFLTHLIDAIGLLHCRSFFTSNFANYFSIQICLQIWLITILHNYCCSCCWGVHVVRVVRMIRVVSVDTRTGIENKESFTKGLLCNIQGVFLLVFSVC